MRLRIRPTCNSPIAVDLGWGSTKLLQVTGTRIHAADEIPVPPDVGDDVGARLALLGDRLGAVLQNGSFRGRRLLLAMPSFCTRLQAIRLDGAEASVPEGAMHASLGGDGGEWMIRPIEVSGGHGGNECICQAISRSVVLRHVEALHAMRLEVCGVLAQPRPIVAAFDHLNRRSQDADQCTVHVDMGADSTTVVMAHGGTIVLARSLAFGGRHFDARIAGALHCDLDAARRHRLDAFDAQTAPATARTSMPVFEGAAGVGANAPSAQVMDRRGEVPPPSLGPKLEGAPAVADQVDLAPLIDMLCDELRLCLRHHAAIWPDIEVARVIFVGGEARQEWLCREVVRRLHLPGQIGDPLARLNLADGATTPARWSDRARPDWSVAAGLAAMSRQETSDAH